MDPRYPLDEFARASGNGAPSSVRDTRDASDNRPGGYSARWRDDRHHERYSLAFQERARSLSARAKDGTDYQYDCRLCADAELRMTSEKYSDVPSKPVNISTFDEAAKPAKKTIDTPPVFETIRQLMTPLLKEDKPQSAEFEVHWDVDGFFNEELEGQRNLAPVLTLSGTMNRAFAATCEDYVRCFWPEFGMGVLERLFPISKDPGYQEDGVPLGVDLQGLNIDIPKPMSNGSSTPFCLKATGTTESLTKLAQLLSWIAANFRRPKCGELSYSTPTFRKTGDAVYVIGLSELEPIESDLCWRSMFANGVIAKYFPTPERDNEVGLEIPFNLMVVLCRIWYPMEYLDGFVLKGHSTLLVPTLRNPASVQWHFISNKDPNKKIKMSAIQPCCGDFVENIDLRTLQTARAFVGWTMEAYVHAGAKTSGYESIRDSKVPYSPRRPRLAREMTSGIGTSGLGFFGVQLGAKVVIPKSVFGPVKREYILLEDMLLNSRDNSLLLWDAGTRRGWMISELAVVLMILHVWASRQTDSEALLRKIPFAEHSSDDAKASYQAIRTHRNLQLRSQANGDAEDLMFMTQVENIFTALESRKEEIITRYNASARLSYSAYLKGWELTDIAHSKPWFKEKRIPLDDTCGTWPSVLKKQREVLVLFCRGVGDLIRPSADELFCQTWRSVPKGHSYLAATVASITNLDIHCRAADRFRACTFNGKKCPSRLQELDHKPSSRSIPIPPTGAIIAGKLHHSLYQPCSPALKQFKDVARNVSIVPRPLQETCSVVAMANDGSSPSLPEIKVNHEDICQTPDHDNNFSDRGNDGIRKREMNAC